MDSGIIRSGTTRNLNYLQRSQKTPLLPDDILCAKITGMVLQHGDHNRICAVSEHGRQYEIGLGVDGIEMRCLNTRRFPGQEISQLRGAFPRALLASSQESIQRLEFILGKIIDNKDCVRVVHKNHEGCKKREIGDTETLYDFGITDCHGFIVKVLCSAGIKITSLDLIGSFALLYNVNAKAQAYGIGVSQKENE